MRWIHINIGGYFVHPNSGTHHSDNHRIQRKEGSLANDTRGLGKVSSFKKFYLIRQLSKKQQASLEESDPPPSWTFVDASLACCCDNKKAGNPAFPQSLDPLFHQHEDGKRKSDKDIFYKFAPSIQWKDTPSKFFQMVCTAGQKLKLGQFWSLQRSPHLKIGKHEMDSVK